MNGKHYIGDRATTFKSTGRTRGIDGVALVVDDGTEYRAGDQTGYVLELECPYGTQAMADGLLEKLRGRSYEGFETTGAALPMGAELGDGVTVRGLYGPIVRRRVQFVGDLAADVSAPTGGDTDHEFGFTDPVQRQIQRAAARSRSYIEKKADEIKLGVESEVDGKLSEITVDLEGVSASVRELSGDVGEVRGDLSLKVGRNENNQIVSMLNASANEINIKGNRFVLDSDNFKVAADGTATMTNAKITSGGTESSITIDGGSMATHGAGWAANYSGFGVEFIEEAYPDYINTRYGGSYCWFRKPMSEGGGEIEDGTQIGWNSIRAPRVIADAFMENGAALAEKYQGKIVNTLNVGGSVELRTDDEGGNVTLWNRNGQLWEMDGVGGSGSDLRFYTNRGGQNYFPFTIRHDGISVNDRPVQLTSLASGVELLGGGETETVSFPAAFGAAPVVTASADGAAVRVSNVTRTGFDVAVQGESGVLSRVGWLAAEV